jgi:hypothetical protein
MPAIYLGHYSAYSSSVIIPQMGSAFSFVNHAAILYGEKKKKNNCFFFELPYNLPI